MFCVRQLLSNSNRCHARSSLLHLLHQHNNSWSSSPPSDRSLSTNSHAELQSAVSTVSAVGESLQQCTTDTLANAASTAAAASSSPLHNNLLTSLASSSSDTSSGISQLLDVSSLGGFAAQPLEPLWQMFNPVVMGCSVWEMVHSTTGLPWWASIPLTTLALRTTLLPLTVKAKSAGLNFVLAQQATQTATNLIEHWKQQQVGSSSSGGTTGSTGGGSSSSSRMSSLELGIEGQLKRPSRWRLSRMYYRYYRKQHGTTSLWWWTANIALQLNVFLAMSLALKQMAATQWPGFIDQGLWWFKDLTHPSVMFGTASTGLLSGAYCPYGFAGFLLPVVLMGLYYKTIQESPLTQRSVALNVMLETFLLPYAVVACTGVPQATLLYWLTNSAFFMGLQHALQSPRVASYLELPAVMLPPQQQNKEARERAELEALKAQQLVCGSEDDGFLRYLAASYLARGMHQQALQCLQRLTVLAPGDAAAFRALGTTAAELQQWPLSARAFERAAELHAVAVDREEHIECLLLAAKQWLNATAEARAMQRRGRKQQQQQQQQQVLAGTQQQQSQQQQQQQVAAADVTTAAATAAAGAGAGPADVADSSSSSSSSGAARGGGAAAGVTEDKAAAAVQPGQQQEYIKSALASLQEAIHFQPDHAADAYYLLSMALAADGQWEPAFEAATTFWRRSLALAENDQTARINAAAKLLPVLNNMCRQRSKQQDFSALVTVAQLAVEVAKCGWDRQTEEQLRDTLVSAAHAAAQQGMAVVGQQITELQQQLPGGVVGVTRK